MAAMPVQIANPQVVAKIERLSRLTGLGKAAAVEAALDQMLAEVDPWRGLDALLAQMDRMPDRSDAFEPLEWDEQGLSR